MVDTAPREAIAGETFEIVVEARDTYGNARGIGEAWSRVRGPDIAIDVLFI